MEDKEHIIRHPEEFLDMMKEITNNGGYDKIKEKVISEEKEELTMYDIFDDAENIGLEKGLRATVEVCHEVGMSADEARRKIEKKFEMSRQDAGDAVKRYWGNVQKDAEREKQIQGGREHVHGAAIAV